MAPSYRLQSLGLAQMLWWWWWWWGGKFKDLVELRRGSSETLLGKR